MKITSDLKAGFYGAVVGAVALAVVGFSWGGWTTASMARERTADAAQQQVVAALVPICLEQARRDPEATATLAELRDAASFNRRSLMMETGWAMMPGADAADRDVAIACLEQLAARF